ncbi:MAG: extracellular solute-binding protein, partial [Dehalococcoidia bacterium]|nr:extracellular solute-binding protein [Dehalococcoidia bacterium]
DVNFVVGRPPELVQKLESEANAGLFLADVINLGGGSSLTMLKPKGLLKPIEPELILPEVKDPKSWVIGKLPFVDADGTVFGMLANYERYAAVNTDMVKEREVTSLKGLLDPKWKNKMIMLDPSMPGAGASVCAFLGRVWGMEKALEWAQGVADQGTVFTRDKRQHVEWVAKGSKAIAIAPSPDVFSDFKSVGSPITSVKIDEGGNAQTVGGAIMLPAKPAHPNASTVFINWLLSKEGQAAYVKGIGVPGARVDAPKEGIDELFFPGPGDKITVTGDEEFFLLQGKMRPKLTEIVANQAK